MYRHFCDIVTRKSYAPILSQTRNYCKFKCGAKHLLYSAVLFTYFWLFEVEFQAFMHIAKVSARYQRLPKTFCAFSRKVIFGKIFHQLVQDSLLFQLFIQISERDFSSSSSVRSFLFPQKPHDTTSVVYKCALPAVSDFF